MNNEVIKAAIEAFFRLIELLIILRILLSIIIRDFGNPILRFLYEITEPILSPFRRLFEIFKINTGMFDFSPLLAFLALSYLRAILLSLL